MLLSSISLPGYFQQHVRHIALAFPSNLGVRHFTTSGAVYVRKVKGRSAPTKAKLAARERKKALKAKKSMYEKEKMPLVDAINVLRVSVLFKIDMP